MHNKSQKTSEKSNIVANSTLEPKKQNYSEKEIEMPKTWWNWSWSHQSVLDESICERINIKLWIFPLQSIWFFFPSFPHRCPCDAWIIVVHSFVKYLIIIILCWRIFNMCVWRMINDQFIGWFMIQSKPCALNNAINCSYFASNPSHKLRRFLSGYTYTGHVMTLKNFGSMFNMVDNVLFQVPITHSHTLVHCSLPMLTFASNFFWRCVALFFFFSFLWLWALGFNKIFIFF